MRRITLQQLGTALLLSWTLQAQDPVTLQTQTIQDEIQNRQELLVQHADCSLFGPDREKFASTGLRFDPKRYALSGLTEQVASMITPASATTAGLLPPVPGGSRTNLDQGSSANLIDKYIFQAFKDNNVTPAPMTTDYEFIRRVTLDLTGRIPTPDRVQSFIADTTPTKRAKLIDELMTSPQYVDKWTMYWGDRLKNTDNKAQVRMYPEGRNAFYAYIKDAVTNNKPADVMAREIIAMQGENSFDNAQGPINWMVGGVVTGGPTQDIFDSQTATIAETFLGLANLNCLLCHNGRGHLDQLNLWGAQSTRYQAWQMASFVSHTWVRRLPYIVNGMTVQNYAYYSVTDDSAAAYKVDYTLNTTTGNRPARTATDAAHKTVAPVYMFNGHSPHPGENYRAALAREVTGDFQFARATVNYVWKQIFNRGIVEPANQFDLARLDPDNPPPDPWTLQPSNARLLNALAQDFIAHNYDMKYLIRQMVNSNTYQLSSVYPGQWNANWEPLFARHLVRRLWGEEIMDALSQASGTFPTYNVNGFGKFNYAMQSPEPKAILNAFLATFLPGNRDDAERRSDSAIQQALDMMNDPIVMSRVKTAGAGATANLQARAFALPDDQLVKTMYMAVLSRLPNDQELQIALTNLKAGDRKAKSEDLLWSLYNKVDFLFNY